MILDPVCKQKAAFYIYCGFATEEHSPKGEAIYVLGITEIKAFLATSSLVLSISKDRFRSIPKFLRVHYHEAPPSKGGKVIPCINTVFSGICFSLFSITTWPQHPGISSETAASGGLEKNTHRYTELGVISIWIALDSLAKQTSILGQLSGRMQDPGSQSGRNAHSLTNYSVPQKLPALQEMRRYSNWL